jgi:hypothetical protein
MSPLTRLSAALALAAATAAADPLYDQDNGPVSGSYNFVDSTEGATLLPKGRIAWSLSTITSSHAISSSRGDEQIVLDGETSRVELRLRYAPTERLEIGLELPYLGHSEGQLDALIDTWHDLFGLPGGDREVRDNDLLEFRYADSSGERLNFVDSASGIGDLRLSAGWRLGDDADHRRALRFAATLPTGEAADLHGLDAVTLGIGYAGDASNVTADGRLSLFYRVHATWIDEPALLPDTYNEWIGHLAGGFGYAAADWLELRAQVLARTATHDSELAVLGEPSVILSFGGNIRLGDRYTLSLSVGEDIKVASSPDVSFQLALRYRPAD